MPGQGRSSLDDQALFINMVSDLGDGALPSGLFKFKVQILGVSDQDRFDPFFHLLLRFRMLLKIFRHECSLYPLIDFFCPSGRPAHKASSYNKEMKTAQAACKESGWHGVSQCQRITGSV